MGLAASKQESLWEACGFGHTQRVKKFIEEGIDVNWVSYTHNSCAIHVASQGKEEIVKMLIEAKCNVNVKDDRGNLALHHAAMKGHAKIMQMLIDAGSELNTQDKNGWTPLLNAAYFCQPEAIEVLLKNGCDVHLQTKDSRHALHEACRSQSEDENGLAIIVCHLVEAGCDINAKSSDVGEADFTPLMFAAYHGHSEIVEVLVEANCDINAQGSNGWTALHWAADRGYKEVIRVLLEWGIDPLITGRRDQLAVDRAQDNELKELLADVTSQAKLVREQEMTSRSPVSTTSPLSSSRSTSFGSGMDADDEPTDDHVTDHVIDNDLAARLEVVAMERERVEKEVESSCTSGTISEKDEKETLEKDVSDDPPSCESLPEDVTLISGSSQSSKETVVMTTDGDIEITNVVAEAVDKSGVITNCDQSQQSESVGLPDPERSETNIESSHGVETSCDPPQPSEHITIKDVNKTQEANTTTGTESHRGPSDDSSMADDSKPEQTMTNTPASTKQDTCASEELKLNAESTNQDATEAPRENLSSQDAGGHEAVETPINDSTEPTGQTDSDTTTTSNKEGLSPKHDAIARLVSGVTHEDGNVSDDLLGDGGYSDGLGDSDME